LDAANVAPSAAGTCWVVDRRSPMVADSPLPRSKIGARVRFAAANVSNWQPWKGHARLRPFRTTRHSTPRGLSPQTVPVHGMARRVPTSLSSRSRTTAATGSRVWTRRARTRWTGRVGSPSALTEDWHVLGPFDYTPKSRPIAPVW